MLFSFELNATGQGTEIQKKGVIQIKILAIYRRKKYEHATSTFYEGLLSNKISPKWKNKLRKKCLLAIRKGKSGLKWFNNFTVHLGLSVEKVKSEEKYPLQQNLENIHLVITWSVRGRRVARLGLAPAANNSPEISPWRLRTATCSAVSVPLLQYASKSQGHIRRSDPSPVPRALRFSRDMMPRMPSDMRRPRVGLTTSDSSSPSSPACSYNMRNSSSMTWCPRQINIRYATASGGLTFLPLPTNTTTWGYNKQCYLVFL